MYLGNVNVCHCANVRKTSCDLRLGDKANFLTRPFCVINLTCLPQVASDFKAYDGGVYDNPSCSTLPEQVSKQMDLMFSQLGVHFAVKTLIPR